MNSTSEKIKTLENEIEQLSVILEAKRDELDKLRRSVQQDEQTAHDKNTLTNLEINRFSRQIILPEVGVKGQIKLKNAKVLIVGAGGLGKLNDFIPFVPSMSRLTYECDFHSQMFYIFTLSFY